MQATFPLTITALTMAFTGLVGNGTAAADAPLSAEDLLRMPPLYRSEYIRQQIERQRLTKTPVATRTDAPVDKAAVKRSTAAPQGKTVLAHHCG